MKIRFFFFSLVFIFFLISCAKTDSLNLIIADDHANDSIFVGYGDVEVLKHDIFRDYYVDGLSEYHPDDATIDSLRPSLKSVTFRVVMGTWDSRSRFIVPRLFNVLFSVGNFDPTLRSNVELIGVDRLKNAGNVDLKTYHVRRLPLVVVYRDGVEIGRIEGKISKPMELVLLNILNKK